jgi:23S rRNA (guanosine2251-2'-O)-methyltransferase
MENMPTVYQPPTTNNTSLFVLANNIRSLYNVGALFRLCDGVGVVKLFLTGITGAPFDDLKHARQRNQITKTALEGLQTVQWEYHPDPLPLIQQLKSQQVQIVALEQTLHSQSYTAAAYQASVCLILGHETEGVEQSVQNLADLIIEIPMYGQGKSLNVISSASIALYHIKNQFKPT